MAKITVELVKYDMDKTKKRKRANFIVDSKSEVAIIDKLERIHKGEKVQAIHEIVWGEEEFTPSHDVEYVTGKVKFFDEEKGFGFIRADIDIEDLFFHASALGGEVVYDNDLVEFEVSDGPKGPIAINIRAFDDN